MKDESQSSDVLTEKKCLKAAAALWLPAHCHLLYLYPVRNSGFRDSAATSIITIS